jgi:hypothetical protein
MFDLKCKGAAMSITIVDSSGVSSPVPLSPSISSAAEFMANAAGLSLGDFVSDAVNNFVLNVFNNDDSDADDFVIRCESRRESRCHA